MTDSTAKLAATLHTLRQDVDTLMRSGQLARSTVELQDGTTNVVAALGAGVEAEKRTSVLAEAQAELEQSQADLEAQLAGVTPMVWSEDEPSGWMVHGSTWYHTQAGKLVAVWEQAATTEPARWEQRPVASSAIATLEVGKLRASSAVLDTAVIEQLWAQAVVAKFLTATERIITKNVIATGAVTADAIAANAVTASTIIAGAVTAGAIEANALNGKTITGSIVQTTATANRGIKLTLDAFRAYNTAGLQVFGVNTATGDVYVAGQFTTGTGTERIVVAANKYRGNPAMIFESSLYTASQKPLIVAGTGVVGDEDSAGSITMQSAIRSGNSSSVTLNPDGTWGLGGPAGIYADGAHVYARGADNTAVQLSEDTGWVDMKYQTGFTAGTAGQLQYRIRAGLCYLRGGASGTFVAGTYHVVATGLPLRARPVGLDARGGGIAQGMRHGGYEVNRDGSIKLGYNDGISSGIGWVAFTSSFPIE